MAWVGLNGLRDACANRGYRWFTFGRVLDGKYTFRYSASLSEATKVASEYDALEFSNIGIIDPDHGQNPLSELKDIGMETRKAHNILADLLQKAEATVRHMDEQHECNPTNLWIALTLGCSRDTVNRWRNVHSPESGND